MTQTRPQIYRITPDGDAFIASRLTPAGWQPIAAGARLACEQAILRAAPPWPRIEWRRIDTATIQYTVR